MKNRKENIIRILLQEGKISVKELSEKFAISEVSIRKDLSDLENEGRLKRVHGGAIPIKNRFLCKDLEERKVSHLDEKYKIAQKAFDLIENNEVIFLDCSSINILLAQLIFNSTKTISVVTNMLEIINILSMKENIHLYALQGFFSNKLGGFISPNTKKELLKFNIDKSFVGCSGVNILKKQVSTDDLEEGELKKLAIEVAKEGYLIFEKVKLDTYDFYNYISLDKIDNIISSLNIEDQERTILEEMEIKIY